MKKDNRANKIALVALTGLLSSGILMGCQKEENNEFVQEQTLEEYFVPDYAFLKYEYLGEENAKVVEVSKVDDSTLSCQSVTTPDLVMIITKNGDEISYSIAGVPAFNVQLDTQLYSYVQQYCTPENSLYISKDTINKIEENYDNERPISSVLAEDANGEWNVYKNLHRVTIQNEDGEYEVLLMGAIEEEKSHAILRSLTTPELFLEIIYNEDYTITYLLKTNALLPEQNVDFTKSNVVIEDVVVMGLSQSSYEYVLQLEAINEENNNFTR